MKKRNEVIATILFCAIMTVGSFSVNAEQESQNEAVRKRNQCNKPEKHDEEVPDVWCHSIKADREITE